MVIQGHDSTLPVTMDQMVYHCAAVTRGAKRAHVVGDLPFMSYQASPTDAVRNAGRLVAEGGAQAVKLEGGEEFADAISQIVRSSIPVMGHLGLTPQSVHKMGGYVVQGRDEAAAGRIIHDAIVLEQLGCYALVLEGVPLELAKAVTEKVSIPTIGIGAGPHCDGQVLVCYDLLGMNPDFKPKFVKRYADLYHGIQQASREFFAEVRAESFPGEEHSFKSKALHLVASNSDRENGVDKPGPVYGVPV
jgi:3-methyl-2-oxobutanoate hydroxymethyltransferase